ncbi:unnamed protein product [Effrenium voratum]|uniref:Carbohydrate kinase PfkB domain-containing protein n=1 Tax=Effrenium voratum TaxID=2562239 RepID=A0AA36MQQ6_9DINO|nr:unnamed protein product [Effrenium voratum]CAJ1424546.1 unnamed protein product [Effrenium voratum]
MEAPKKALRRFSVATFGEAMLRFQPVEAAVEAHLPQPFLRSVGGDELNVAVALSLLEVPVSWISVLPCGPMGDVIQSSCEHHSVKFQGLRVDGDLGIFTVLPEAKTVHYQRRHSAFAEHAAELRWSSLVTGHDWLHVSGITPLLGHGPRESWAEALQAATKTSVQVSLDLNHRKQLGTLSELWDAVAPFAGQLELLILSAEQLQGLALLLLHKEEEVESDSTALSLMGELQRMLKCKRIAMCRKRREEGVQCRWSLLSELSDTCSTCSTFSTSALPVYHVPQDECGGGSAWAAGMIQALRENLPPMAALRRGDLLAALCQDSAGDFSRVTRPELLAAERRWSDGPAKLTATRPSSARASEAEAVEDTLQRLRRAKVLAILRAKGSPEKAVERGLELAALGCCAMEVTLDSSDWRHVLSSLRRSLPADVVLGVGTVMDDSVPLLGEAKALGAGFALSPIDPVDFVETCANLGLLAVPSAFTSNECWALHRRGVRLIKLFHAGLVSPKILQSMLDVTPLQSLKIMPSGGVSPANCQQWLDAGACVVGMGSNLVGKDISCEVGSSEHQAALEDWKAQGRRAAEALFAESEKNARGEWWRPGEARRLGTRDFLLSMP